MKVMKRKLSDLVPDPNNARKHSARNLAAIKASIDKFDQAEPLVVQASTGLIIGGNGRYAVMKELGYEHAYVVELDIDNAKARALAIALNRTAELAEWDDDVLAATLQSLDAELLDAVGFDQKDLGKLLAPEVIEDEVPEPPSDPITKPGDLWLLGNHRLLCGDSTNADDVARVMNGQRAALCLTDPPYGLGSKKASGKNNYNSYVDSRANLEALAKGWLPIARKLCNTVVFSPGITNAWIYPEADWIMCWFYGGGALRSPWGFNSWQPFLCYGKDPSLATGNGSRPDAVDMNIPANAGDIDHPCPKPLRLWTWLIERLSFSATDILYDPFLGSGTTIIAAEQLGRRCYGLEIDPTYCDVIVARWERLTGRKATRGQT